MILCNKANSDAEYQVLITYLLSLGLILISSCSFCFSL